MLSDYRTLVDSLVRDDSGVIAADDRDQAIALAVVRYSTDRPIETVEEVEAAGGPALDLPTGWQSDFSRLVGVFSIRGPFDHQAVGAELKQTPAGWRIRLDAPLAAGSTAEVFFTLAHSVTTDEDTIPIKDREAVAGWAAANCMEQLASHYSGMREPTLQADTVDWNTKGREYATRAKRLREIYLDHLGIDPKRTVPAGTAVNWQQADTRGRDRLIHSQRRR